MKTPQQRAGEPACHQGGTSSTGASPLLNSITQNCRNFIGEKPKRKNFTQIPNGIIDSDLSETAIMGFIRFFRHFGRVGSFDGSVRKLCKILRMARATVTKMIREWVKAGWVLCGSHAKDYEDGGEVMSLLILSDCLWLDISEEDESGSLLGQGGTETSQHGSKGGHAGAFVSQRGSSSTLKSGGNIKGNMESNTDSKIGEEYRERQTEPLPVLPSFPSEIPQPLTTVTPPPSDPAQTGVFRIEEITPDTPHSLDSIFAIGAHYLGDKVSLKDAEAFVRKTQSTATLVGAHEVRRQLIRNITFMLYSDHSLNWYHGKKNQVTLRSAVTYYDDYVRKVQETEWMPPPDRLPTWYFAHETTSQQPSEEDYFAGMSKQEAALLSERILAEFPGLKLSWGDLPGGRFTVGLWQGDGQWCDLWQPYEWERRDDQRLQAALEAYEQEVACVAY